MNYKKMTQSDSLWVS